MGLVATQFEYLRYAKPIVLSTLRVIPAAT